MAEGKHTSLGNCYSLEMDRELFPFPCAGGQLTLCSPSLSLSLSLSLRLSLNQSEKETRRGAPSNVQYYITDLAEIQKICVCVCVCVCVWMNMILKKHTF